MGTVSKICHQNKMRWIFLSVALVCVSSIKQEDSDGTDAKEKKPALFYVSSSYTTTTILTATACYQSAGFAPWECKRKKRSFLSDHVMDHVDFQPSQVESGMDDTASEERQGKFLQYWLTTTFTSTTTYFTQTLTIWSVGCTPPGGKMCNL